MINIEIDNGSGFCFGVTTAIRKAEEELASGEVMYSLGDIVHNGMEVNRLAKSGLTTIDHEKLKELKNAKVLLRAHGEPPSTYELAKQNNIEIIDATCPVVLQLQKRIRKQFEENPDAQIVIFGKNGHAEVLGKILCPLGRLFTSYLIRIRMSWRPLLQRILIVQRNQQQRFQVLSSKLKRCFHNLIGRIITTKLLCIGMLGSWH